MHLQMQEFLRKKDAFGNSYLNYINTSGYLKIYVLICF